MIEEENVHGFSRNIKIETDALEKLGYSVGQVKRNTISHLERELKKWQNTPELLDGSHNMRNEQNPVHPPRKQEHRSPSVTWAMPEENQFKKMQDLLQRKKDYTDTLENDPDFDEEDLEDWLDSIYYLEVQLNNHVNYWERKQKKLTKLEEAGLLDAKLAKKWAEKQEAKRK